MTGDSSKQSIVRRIFGWVCNWRSPGRVILNLVVMCALIWGLYAEENSRGKRDWEAYKRHLIDAGVETDWNKFIPAPVPDDQNFAMTPFMAPMFDFNKRPLDPGQSPYQNTEGWERIKSYAAALTNTNEFWKGGPDLQTGQKLDLGAVLFTLEAYTNSAATNRSFSARADAATAVLATCDQFKPELEELRAASHRPFCRYNISYDYDNPMEILVPHLNLLWKVDRLLQIRASAELELGKMGDAFADVEFMMFLAGSLRNDPFAISHGLRLTILRAAGQIIWEGLAEHKWTDAQLLKFQDALEKVAVIPDLKKALMAREAAFGFKFFEYIQTHPNGFRDMNSYAGTGFWVSALLVAPSGWLYLEEISWHRLYEDEMPRFSDAHSTQIYPRIIEEFWDRIEHEKTKEFSLFRHHKILMHFLMPNLHVLFQNNAFAQTEINESTLACALERYRMANGKYPQSLVVLVPQFIENLPQDVCSGQPLKYRLGNDGSFALYSVGWNEKDDGGLVGTAKDGQPNRNLGDWVWPQYPGKQHALN